MEYSRNALSSGDYDMVVLDEVLFAAKKGLVDEEALVELISSRPEKTHLVLTGRGCPQSVIDMADVVTEMKEVKHAFAEGVGGQAGVEF